MKYMLAAVAICFAFYSCSSSKPLVGEADVKGVPLVTDQDGYSHGNGPDYGPKYPEHSQSDWSVTMDVKSAISSDPELTSIAQHVTVSTTDGVVTLSGKIANKDDMNKIIRAVKMVEGVQSVNNQMRIFS